MASTRMMTRAIDEYRQAIAALNAAEDANAPELDDLRAQVARMRVWLECAAVGDSDRDCEWASGWAPARRPIRRATRQLMEVG